MAPSAPCASFPSAMSRPCSTRNSACRIRWRWLWACVMVVGIVIVDFLITHILPGDPVDVLVGDFPAPPDYILQVRREFGLHQPLSTQLWLYIVNLAQGNLGFSFLNRQPV